MQRSATPPGHVVRRALGATALATAAAALVAVPSAPAQAQDEPALYLVTLVGPGTTGSSALLPAPLQALAMRGAQDAVLAGVGAADPVYRWTTVLDGVAVRLTVPQAARLAADPRVVLVERDRVRPLAGVRATLTRATAAGIGSGRTRGGAGVVIGVVDTGLAGDSPLFSPVPGLGRLPTGFSGHCPADSPADSPEDGSPTCNGKVLAAESFVSGFGVDRVRPSASLTALDDDGHGTLVASIAAGDAGVPVRVRGQRLASYAGQAPQARLAIYKACWGAPDPSLDGCSSADVVAAVDRATADGVDVLNLSLGAPGPAAGPVHDTVDRALLGAAEADVVVVTAAGAGRTVEHASPWALTVGATAGAVRQGAVRRPLAAPLTGAMSSLRGAGPAALVLGARAPAPGRTVRAARICAPGSLDARRVAGRIVVCTRGGVGRVDKSAAVREADGVGMVLVNTGPGSLDADFQSVPTVHLAASAGRRLRAWQARHPGVRVRLQPRGVAVRAPRVAATSPSGSPRSPLVSPDVVAPGTGVVGAVPGEPGWDQLTGTSAAAAQVSGVAALLRQQRPSWDAARIRSALVTSSSLVPRAGVLRAGAGSVRAGRADRPGLVYDVDPADLRAWLDSPAARLNTASAVLAPGRVSITRRVTNVGRRALYFSSSAVGFDGAVIVTPAALRLRPGRSATYTVSALRGPGSPRLDDGYVVWRGATGTVTRIPVLVRR